MSLVIVQFSCFALLAAATCAECRVKDGIRNKSTHKLAHLLHAENDILAGEDTPVWLARQYYPHETIVYQRLRNEENFKTAGTVKESLHYWNSIKHKKGFRVRRKRRFDENILFQRRRDTGNDSLISSSEIKKENTVGDKVLYPSVLVVVDYHDVHPNKDKRVPWLMKENIIYALAFWSTVGRSLKKIRNPRVSLRIAGIVISTTRNASPYLTKNRGKKTLVNALPSMLKYWKNIAKKNSDFRIGSYDIVAHMTDLDPRPLCQKCIQQHKKRILYAASKGPPCKLPKKIAGFIIHDDFAFSGLYLAISTMPKVLGSSAPPMFYNSRKWSREALNAISRALKGAACMSKPKGRYPPGKPVAPILAGELFPSAKQCEATGHKPEAFTCWHTNVTQSRRSNCQYLACSEHHNSRAYCSKVERTLDGTFCDEKNTMICLDGDCIEKK